MTYRKLGNHWYTLGDIGWHLISFKSPAYAKRFGTVHKSYRKANTQEEKHRLLTLMQSMHW